MNETERHLRSKNRSLALIDQMCRIRTHRSHSFAGAPVSPQFGIRHAGAWSPVSHFCGLLHRLASELKLLLTSTLCHSVRHAGQLSTPLRRSIGYNWWVQDSSHWRCSRKRDLHSVRVRKCNPYIVCLEESTGSVL